MQEELVPMRDVFRLASGLDESAVKMPKKVRKGGSKMIWLVGGNQCLFNDRGGTNDLALGMHRG